MREWLEFFLCYSIMLLVGFVPFLPINAVWAEIPLMQRDLPEGDGIGAQITLWYNFSILAPLGLSLLTARGKLTRRREVGVSWAVAAAGPVLLVLVALFYKSLWAGRSYPLLNLAFLTGLVGGGGVVSVFGVMSHVEPVYMSALAVGTGLSGVLPAVVAIVQDPGSSSPRFSGFSFLMGHAALGVAALCAFAASVRHRGLMDCLAVPSWSTASRSASAAAATGATDSPQDTPDLSKVGAGLHLLGAVSPAPSVESVSEALVRESSAGDTHAHLLRGVELSVIWSPVLGTLLSSALVYCATPGLYSYGSHEYPSSAQVESVINLVVMAGGLLGRALTSLPVAPRSLSAGNILSLLSFSTILGGSLYMATEKRPFLASWVMVLAFLVLSVSNGFVSSTAYLPKPGEEVLNRAQRKRINIFTSVSIQVGSLLGSLVSAGLSSFYFAHQYRDK